MRFIASTRPLLCVLISFSGINCSSPSPSNLPESQIAPFGGQDHDSGKAEPHELLHIPLPPVIVSETETSSAWIGSPCSTHQDCDYPNGKCLSHEEGFPNGMCSLDCSLYCPDLESSPTTFCIAAPPATTGLCMSRCDSSYFPTNQGCRTGYTCKPWPRYNQPETIVDTCVPQAWSANLPCDDPTNLLGDDHCYFQLISFGHPPIVELARTILEGNASANQALLFLNLNFTYSQLFIENDLDRTIHPNFSSGHHSIAPMKGIIVHYTAAQREDNTIRYFAGPSPHASTHFVIGSFRNGLIVQIFSHEHRTWHAGSTYNRTHFGFDFANAGYLIPENDIGWTDYAGRDYTLTLPLTGNKPVEITDGIPGHEAKYASRDFWQPYTYYQIISYILVGRALHLVYNLEPHLIQRHGDVASSRVDPGPALPFTHATEMIFSNENAFEVSWLNEFKVNPQWIIENPQAR